MCDRVHLPKRSMRLQSQCRPGSNSKVKVLTPPSFAAPNAVLCRTMAAFCILLLANPANPTCTTIILWTIPIRSNCVSVFSACHSGLVGSGFSVGVGCFAVIFRPYLPVIPNSRKRNLEVSATASCRPFQEARLAS